ncbi:MAG: SGNH/GDSL hydrolase family protein [Patescibacteria group bacterium]|jgi:lysophospholipase L1-like esterase
MPKKYWIIICFVLAVGIYLNRSYAYIYQRIDKAGLNPPVQNQLYSFGYTNDVPSYEDYALYVALGDSLTAGVGVDQYEQSFPYLLAKKIADAKQPKVITLKTLAVPGAKTADVLTLLPTVIANKPQAVILLIGVNDIHGNVSKDDFKKNYEQIVSELTKKTSAKVYLINLPAIGANNLLLLPYNYYFRALTKNFNKVIKELAEQYNLTYIDLHTPTADVLKHNGNYYSVDFFHPSAIGYQHWAEIIYADLHK